MNKCSSVSCDYFDPSAFQSVTFNNPVNNGSNADISRGNFGAITSTLVATNASLGGSGGQRAVVVWREAHLLTWRGLAGEGRLVRSVMSSISRREKWARWGCARQPLPATQELI